MSIDSFVTGVVMTAGAAAAATGGMVAGENQTVVTGDSSASVQVTNIVNADGNGGSSYTEVIKTVDGNTTKEVKEETFAPGEPVIVETVVNATSKGNAESAAEATVETETITSSTNSATEEVATTSAQAGFLAEEVDTVLEKIASIWSAVVSFFSF